MFYLADAPIIPSFGIWACIPIDESDVIDLLSETDWTPLIEKGSFAFEAFTRIGVHFSPRKNTPIEFSPDDSVVVSLGEYGGKPIFALIVNAAHAVGGIKATPGLQ